MKVWITKYALTKGIIETEIALQEGVWTIFENNIYMYTNERGKHWHTAYKRAKLRAEEMRQKKIASLKKQIEKLEKLNFEEAPNEV